MHAIVRQTAVERSVFGLCLVLLGVVLLAGDAAGAALEPVFQFGMVLAAALMISMRPAVPGTSRWIAVPGSRLWALYVLTVFLQALPMPQAVLARLSPNALQDRIQAAAVVAAARSGDIGPDILPAWFSVAYDARLAAAAGTRLAACTILFYLLLQLLKSRQQINELVWLIVLCSLGRAGIMLLQKPVQPDAGASGLVEIGLMLAIGLFLIYRNPPAMAADGGLGRLQSLYQSAMHRFSAEGFNAKAVLPAVIGAILILALAGSGSTESLARAGGAILLSWVCVRFRRWPHTGPAAAMLLAATVSVLLAGGHGSPGIADLMMDYPVWGVGAANALNLIPRYAQVAWPGGPAPWGRLIRISIETGATGLLLLSAAGILFIHNWIGAWTRRHDPHARGIGFAVMASCVVMLFGSSSLLFSEGQSPAIAFTAALAAGYAAVYRKGRGLMQWADYRFRPLHWRRPVQLAGAAGFLLICLAALVFPQTVRLPAAAGETDPSGPPDRQALENRLLDNPASGKTWHELARLYEQTDADPLQYLTRWLPLADRCYSQAVKNRPADTDILFQAARYWVRRSAMLPELPDAAQEAAATEGFIQTRQQGIQQSMELFRRLLFLDPGRLIPAAEAVRAYYPSDAIILGIVPVQDASMRSGLLRYLWLQDG